MRGVARSVQRHTLGNFDTLSFRIDQYDAAGNRLPPVGVELRPYRGGQVSDGEDVDVVGHWKDGTLRAETVVNRTTGANIRGGWFGSRWGYVALAIFAIPFVAVPAFIIFLVVTELFHVG